MHSDVYQLNVWKAFKTQGARDYVVNFVVKTLDKLAYPLSAGGTLDKDLFQISRVISSKFQRFDEMQFFLYVVQALKLGRYSLAAEDDRADAFEPIREELE